jgi:ATP phosphoribosyltransferase
MLKVAIPNKGQLAEPAAELLKEAGYLKGSQSKNLVLVDRENDVEFFFLRPKDIAVYVAQGSLDMGITGQDMVQDSGVVVDEISELGFGAATFSIAGINGLSSLTELNGKAIATSYPGLLQQWLSSNSLKANIVKLDGAVENAIGLGVADFVADVVATFNVTYTITTVGSNTTFSYAKVATNVSTVAVSPVGAAVRQRGYTAVTDFASQGSTTTYNVPGNSDYNADAAVDFIIASSENPTE